MMMGKLSPFRRLGVRFNTVHVVANWSAAAAAPWSVTVHPRPVFGPRSTAAVTAVWHYWRRSRGSSWFRAGWIRGMYLRIWFGGAFRTTTHAGSLVFLEALGPI